MCSRLDNHTFSGALLDNTSGADVDGKIGISCVPTFSGIGEIEKYDFF